jgi:hypothetical protein
MRKRSGSITPAYSTDRSLLFSHYPGVCVVSSLEEAKSAVSKLAIFDDTTFQRRVTLETDADWSGFVDSCRDIQDPNAYNLELLLKKCYTSAYSMPVSPSSVLKPQKSANSSPRSSPTALAI